MTRMLPLFPLSKPLFPGALMPLRLFEGRYLRLFREHADNDPFLGVVMTKVGWEVDDEPVTHLIGTSARLLALAPGPHESLEIALQGLSRFKIHTVDWSRTYAMGEVDWYGDHVNEPDGIDALARRAISTYDGFKHAISARMHIEFPDDPLPCEPAELSYGLADRLPCNTWELQRLLEAPSVDHRLRSLVAIIERERTLFERHGATGPAIEHPGQRFLPN